MNDGNLVTIIGRLLGFSFAAGINLYATVAILGLATRFGWVDLPSQYRVFDNNWIIGAAIDNMQKPECLLAVAMNGAQLRDVCGAPLRLRVENQLGYKMVKWIERIEFIESERLIGGGEGRFPSMEKPIV